MSSLLDAHSKLNELLSLPFENEVVEFKEAKNDFDSRKLGRYFSALCNEANLKGHASAWLVLGVNDQRQVVGTSFRNGSRADLDNLKQEIANKTTGRVTFIEIYEVAHPVGRVVLLQIPPAPRGIPIAFEGHEYGRDGQSLGALNVNEYERIRFQSTVEDWSAVVVPDASIEDLDPNAIEQARLNYMAKYPDKKVESADWDTAKFLDKVKLTVKGRLTRAALLLLGKEESEHFLQPADPKIRWLLKDVNGNDRDYALLNNRVAVTLTGKVLDLNYAHLLATDASLTLQEILLLDRVQKRLPLQDEETKLLRDKGLIEGRKPNYFIAKKVAQQTGQKAEYSKNSAFEKQYCLDFICKAIDEHTEMSRRDIDELIWNLLPAWMDETKKRNRIENLLRELRKNGSIVSFRQGSQSVWRRPPE